MKYNIAILITIENLHEELIKKFGENYLAKNTDLVSLLFFDENLNDCIKEFNLLDKEVFEHTLDYWEDKDNIILRNKIREYLKTLFPGYDYILLDVS